MRFSSFHALQLVPSDQATMLLRSPCHVARRKVPMPSSRAIPGGTQGSRAARPGASKPAGAGHERRSRLGLVVAVIVAAVVVLAGIVVLATRDGDETGGATAASIEIGHVHGLGVDPKDGALYAGTHHGLVRIPEDGEATVVADRVQDFMGFTVVGPEHYLASGHPGPGEDGPSSLGLIETTDAGQTWQTLSLAGEADFHALEARHGLVYGVNAMTGEFMVSDDKQTWDTLSDAPLADFAVSREDPDVVVGTTQQGPVLSNDGGRTFQLLLGAPLLQFVSWADDGPLFGVQPDGSIHVSTDGGTTWTERGTLGAAPHAFTATTREDVFAAVDGGILASQDGGQTFDARFKD